MTRKSLSIFVCMSWLCFVSSTLAQKKDTATTPSKKVTQPKTAQPSPPIKTEGKKESPVASDQVSDSLALETSPTISPQQPTSYTLKLRALEQRVNELKERIFRSKARLNLLKETVLHRRIAGSRAIIKHKNEMGGTFNLIQLVYAIDGSEIFNKKDEEGTSLDEKREFEVFNGSITPGTHTISVRMLFRGYGYGVFSYLKGYQFTVRSSHTFTAGEGRQNTILVLAYKKGNPVTTQMQDRPAIKFTTQISAVGAGK